MDLGDNIRLYLPQYLSEDRLTALKSQLKSFGEGHDTGEYFTEKLKSEPFLLQGDGVSALVCNLPDTRLKKAPVLLLSNTCDMDVHNVRLNPSRLMYAPILNLDKYVASLAKREFPKEKIDNHVAAIKAQVVSQILYLPTAILWGNDSIVLFDRIISMPLTKENIEECIKSRSFSLSNYGFYLLLLKLSYHFTRIQEKVDRF